MDDGGAEQVQLPSGAVERRPSIGQAGRSGTARPRMARHRERAGELAQMAADSIEEDVDAAMAAIVYGAADLAASAGAGGELSEDAAGSAPPPVAPPAVGDGGSSDDGSWRRLSDDEGQGVTIAVGTTNRAKLQSVETAAGRMFPAGHLLQPCSADSSVSDQPMSVAETMEGATNRAHAALAHAAARGAPADYGVGIEGGLERVGERWFEAGWVAVVRASDGRVGYGSAGRCEVSGSIVRRLQAGEELCEVMDDLSGQSAVGSHQGMMGIVTRGILQRGECMTHGVYFGFAPFISDEVYWEP